MPKWKLSFSLLCLLALVAGFHCMCMAQTARSEEDRRPQIDVEDYQVDAELSPASQQLKAKASVKFTAVDDSVSYVLLEFNSNLRPDRVYLADKPPAPGAVSSSQDVETTQSDIPHLSRRAKRQPAPKPAAAAVPVMESDSNLLRFSRDEEEHTIRVDLPAVMRRSQSATLVFEYSGTLNSADSSPLEGVQLAKVQEEVSYLLAISRWFPMN